MSVQPWSPGTTYAPGALCVPRSTPPPAVAGLLNPKLADATGWDLSAPLTIQADAGGYAGCGRIVCPSVTAGASATNQAHIGPLTAGQTITATCMAKHATAADKHSSDGAMFILWFKADDTLISQSAGSGLPNLGSSSDQQLSVSGQAPGGAAYCRIGVTLNRSSTDVIQATYFTTNYTAQAPANATMYKATQPKPGKSASTEPVWPPVGSSVTDNEVVWEGVNIDRLVWEASPLLTSGDTEPVWPTDIDGAVHDGTIDWIAYSPIIQDKNCPRSKVVAIMASKVFAVDKDIVRFCATANALDWTTPLDAGYLPTGLQQANANDMAVLAPYRGNLTAFNASSFQNWQVDPDPAAMALLDQMEGIGSTEKYAAQPVGNELFYLSQLGVRSVSFSAGSDNLQAGDIGMPVDPLIQEFMASIANAGVHPRAMYYPSAGQYWLAFPGAESDVAVFTMNGGKGKWSRYQFPFSVDAFAQLGNDCYIRNDDAVNRVDETVSVDYVGGDGFSPYAFDGLVQWPWLDWGSPGVTKMLYGFDLVASGNPEVSVGYDQTDMNAFTLPYSPDPDTMTGGIIAMPVAAPTFSVRIRFPADLHWEGEIQKGTPWSVQAVQLYLQDSRGQP